MHAQLEKRGLSLSGALGVAEVAGRIPEVMRNQAVQQHEEAARRLKTLTRMAAGLVWLIYVAFMVMMIMQLAGIYLSALGGGIK